MVDKPVKHHVLEILEKNRGNIVSGEYIAELLNVSRNIVWRAIKDLRTDGYSIEASTKRGYRLSSENDILSVEGIKPFLRSPDLAGNIKVFKEVDSTSREAKALAMNKAAHGTTVISDFQTRGKGRNNKGFFSPPGSGLYMSMILHPEFLDYSKPTAITAYAAVCVCEVIEDICDMKPSIKWVNDIFLDGKKICGILTEATTVFENQSIGEIILGIGVNVSTKPDDFPENIRGSVGSLYPDGNPLVTRNRLAAEIVNRVLFSLSMKEAELFERYRKRLFILGTDISVVQGRQNYRAKALDIDNNGYLIVQAEDGEIMTLSSGEISILPDS